METKDGIHIGQEIKLYRLGDEPVRYFNNYCYCGNPGYVGEENEFRVVIANSVFYKAKHTEYDKNELQTFIDRMF